MWKSMGPGRAADLLLALSDTWSPQLWRYVRGRDRLCGQVCERGGIAVGRSGDDTGLAAYLTVWEEGPMHGLLLLAAEVAPGSCPAHLVRDGTRCSLSRRLHYLSTRFAIRSPCEKTCHC